MDRSGALSADVIRIDLHCHSLASNRPTDALLRALKCPESYSEPEAVYRQAKARGMSFVPITDHDSIEGVKRIADRLDVIATKQDSYTAVVKFRRPAIAPAGYKLFGTGLPAAGVDATTLESVLIRVTPA